MVTPDPDTLIARITALPCAGRRLIALAGPPASGKSTLAADLVARLGPSAALVPMDGFHLDNRLLDAMGLRDRKGTPESFDLGGLTRLVSALRHEARVYYPLFDRACDIAIAGAGCVTPTHQTVVIEGNYLMFDAPGWRDLAAQWDGCVFLDVDAATLRQRLLRRWQDHGPDVARARVEGNDMPNADLVRRRRLRPKTEMFWP